MSERKKLTVLSELGEFKIIEHLTRNFPVIQPSTLLGVGDDGAILDHKGKNIILTTDLLVEGIHFNLVYTPLRHLGYKAIVVNLSDICAMNGQPSQVAVSIAVSSRFSLEALDELYSGIRLACERYGVDLVGGDTTSSLTGMMLSVAAIGTVSEGKAVYRKGARKSDLIYVTGDLGAAYMGLQVLERERKIFESDPQIQPKLKEYEYILERQLKPEARKDIIEKLAEADILPTSMIDLSDGLSSDMLHICKQSQVGCRIYQEKFPVAQETVRAANEFNIEPFVTVLNGGEDYELLFTVSIDHFERVSEIQGLTVIGHITDQDEGCKFITNQGNEIELRAQGWDTMKQED